MPNWCYNTVTFHGSKESLHKLETALGARHPMTDLLSQPTEGQKVYQEIFDFRNIIAPDPAFWPKYIEPTASFSDSNTWYEWNITNWGCKWSASDQDTNGIETWPDGLATLGYNFSTPWSPPDRIALVHLPKFVENIDPQIAYTWHWEEEQGFGAEWEYANGVVDETSSWDIPNSHAEYEEQDKDCMCVIYEGDKEMCFPDCPTNKAE
jgi:hypothetical protein